MTARHATKPGAPARYAPRLPVPLPPPRGVSFFALILLAPFAIVLTGWAVVDSSQWLKAAAAWLLLAPFGVAAAHQLSRKLSVTPAGLEARSLVRRARVFPWEQVEMLRHRLVTPGGQPARVEVEIRAGPSGTLRLHLAPDAFDLLRRALAGRCPGLVEVDGVSGHVTLRGGGTAVDRRRKTGRAAAAELPRQWAFLVSAVALLALAIVLAITKVPAGRTVGDRLGAAVFATVIGGCAFSLLVSRAKIILRLRGMARRGRDDAIGEPPAPRGNGAAPRGKSRRRKSRRG